MSEEMEALRFKSFLELSALVKAAFHEGHLEGVTSPDQRPDIAWQSSEARAKLEDGE